MICIIQRVKEGRIFIKNLCYSEIKYGLVVFCGISKFDDFRDLEWMVDKIINLRIFENSQGKFDLSLKDINGEVLIVSQFTLLGDASKGRRPDFSLAMEKEGALKYYEHFVSVFKKKYVEEKVKTGVFQADMLVEIHNDGPVTIVIDSSRR
ncbi:MAG: D-aminoacyl-tRNA deacylase [Elusimicrobiales bacterium]|nr:D-aminoacyl-tRNA deacylase [Elusimicrobiales bacterium]